MATDPPDAPPFWRSACRVFACVSLALIALVSLAILQVSKPLGSVAPVLAVFDVGWALLALIAALLGLKGASRSKKIGLWFVALGALALAVWNAFFCLIVLYFPKC